MRPRAARLLTLAACLLVSGCGVHVDEAGRRLERELPAEYPNEVLSVGFEHSALDPPALFITLAPTMNPDEQLDFLCSKLVPRIKATGAAISTTVNYGWWDNDCR
jgi:hypothetical protein